MRDDVRDRANADANLREQNACSRSTSLYKPLRPQCLASKPAPPLVAIAAPTRPSPAAIELRVRILYVDDEPELRQLGELVLRQSGYAVDTAPDGRLAWEALHRTPYHLLVTDSDMPNLTGLELAINIRKAGMRLPIVLTSGFSNFLDDYPRELRLSALIHKPFWPKTLIVTVKQALQTANPRVKDPLLADYGLGGLLASTPRWTHGGINE